MPDRCTIRVNGRDHEVAAEPNTPLLYILRNDLKLKGTRFGCGAGHCGACTVLLDGNAVQSCDTPLWGAVGHEVTTIEGLGTPEAPHPLVRAFVDEQAVQCGYCIDGIIMSAAALLAKNAQPTDAEIATALDRNLCRCGTHARILRAIRRAAEVIA
jgi:aerobic-type carbon monoxide dehydrogenase small subunit (CoxS/CutS family)